MSICSYCQTKSRPSVRAARVLVALHPFQPIRDRIYRGKRSYVPAVLRYNAVPPRLLLEICNLANTEDRRLLQTRAFREKVAAAVVDGILGFFGENP